MLDTISLVNGVFIPNANNWGNNLKCGVRLINAMDISHRTVKTGSFDWTSKKESKKICESAFNTSRILDYLIIAASLAEMSPNFDFNKFLGTDTEPNSIIRISAEESYSPIKLESPIQAFEKY